MIKQDTKASLPRQAALSIKVEVGNEYFRPGLTRLELSRDGRVIVVNKLSGEQAQHEGRVDPEYAARLLDQAVDPSITEPLLRAELGTKPGLPDEPRYRLEVYRESERIYTAQIWRSELVRYPAIASLIKALQTIVEETTHGKVIL